MAEGIEKLKEGLRKLAPRSQKYAAELTYVDDHKTRMWGYSESLLYLAVCKETTPPELALDQAKFMDYLGTGVCPKIIAANNITYCMEYLHPVEYYDGSLCDIESLLEKHVWCRDARWIIEEPLDMEVPEWAMGGKCVIHGDPTLDNLLKRGTGKICISDPIPPQWLRKPSIMAVDHGKMLQSLLGWETVLRGVPLQRYHWPKFMRSYWRARPAVFWCMVALKRIAYRNYNGRITEWAVEVSRELEQLCES